jgi:peptide/nickel transport system substrate-binding protein
MRDPRDLAHLLQATPMNRRFLLQRAAVLGVSLPIFGSLLAACGEDEDDDPGTTDDTDDTADTDPADAPDDEDEEIDTDDADDTADTDDEVDDTDDDAGEAQTGGTLVLLGHQSLESLHPDDAGPTVTWSITRNIHDGLLAVDEYFEIENELASDYEISDDGLEYRLILEEGVLFHDGEEFTAEDVVYTYDWYRDPDSAAITAADFLEVDTVEAEDDYTVVVHMARPDASFLRRGLVAMIVPAHYHEEVGYEQYSGSPIGTGPYQLVEWVPDDFTLVEAFEDHWRGRPNIDQVEMRVIPEASVRAIEIETGGADSSVWSLNVDDNARLLEEPDLTSYVTYSTAVNNFPINNEIPQFQDRETRQAFMHAIDRQRLIDDVFAGAAVIANANLSPALEEWYDPDIPEYEYDPERAEELLEEAGWVMGDDGVRERDGDRLSWTCYVISGDEARRPEAEMVSEMLSQVGAEMAIQEIPTFGDLMRAGEGEMGLHNWTYGGNNGEPDARSLLHSDGGNNFNRYSSPEMDELLERGVEEVDPEVRREIYREVQQLFAEDVPTLFMMYWDWYNFWSPRVQGLPDDVLNGSNLYRRVRELWIEE